MDNSNLSQVSTLFTGFVFLIHNLVSPIYYLAMLINAIKSSEGTSAKLSSYLAVMNKEYSDTEKNISDMRKNGLIVFDQVSVCRDHAKIIDDFSFTFLPGKNYLVIGESGSGKSTLLKLITKKVRATSGKIEINGRDIEDIAETKLNEELFLTPQKPYFFNDSIKNNITLHKDDISNEQLMLFNDKERTEVTCERIIFGYWWEICKAYMNMKRNLFLKKC